MTTFKLFNGQYIVTKDNSIRTFTTREEALLFIFDITGVEKKLNVLRELCIMPHNPTKRAAVEKWLRSYATEIELDNAVHDVLVGNCTIDNVLKRKGLI